MVDRTVASYKMKIVWPNVVGWLIAHTFGIYGATFILQQKMETILFTLVSLWMTAMVR